VAVASGLVADNGSVAVGWLQWLWQCGHFDRWQVDNPFFSWVVVAVVVASGVAGGSGGVAVAGEVGRWQCGHFDRWKVENPFF
jgi:hypothetical protein